MTQEQKDEIRASTTDPKARKMKMSNGGFNSAYNLQIAVDTESRFIIGNYVTNRGSDYGELFPMFSKIKNKYSKVVREWLVDQGYLDHQDIIETQKSGCKVYVNPKEQTKKIQMNHGAEKIVNLLNGVFEWGWMKQKKFIKIVQQHQNGLTQE